MTENEMLDLLTEHIKDLKRRKEVSPALETPDYRETNRYAPQWRVVDGIMYYQLPHGGLVLAIKSATGACFFRASGLPVKVI